MFLTHVRPLCLTVACGLSLVFAEKPASAQRLSDAEKAGLILNGIATVVQAATGNNNSGYSYLPGTPGVMPYPGGPQYVPTTATSSYGWDPYQGRWVTNTQINHVLPSAASPYRNTVVPGTYQQYRYWNGAAVVEGVRWQGYDGQWHGNHQQTMAYQNGNNHTTVVSRTAAAMFSGNPPGR